MPSKPNEGRCPRTPNPGLKFRVSGFGFRVAGCEFQISGFGFRISGSRFRISGFWFLVSDFESRVSGLGFGFWGLGLGSRISGFGFKIPGSGFRVSGFGPRVSNRVTLVPLSVEVLHFGVLRRFARRVSARQGRGYPLHAPFHPSPREVSPPLAPGMYFAGGVRGG